ncbi:MAG: hypothetical protein DRJ42_20365, partial [Deltaproteobacteria bacterium]
ICADRTVSVEQACLLGSRRYFEGPAYEDYVLDCVAESHFPPNGVTDMEVSVFWVLVNDSEAPFVAVVTEPDGRRWVVPIFTLVQGAAAEETIEDLRVFAERRDGRLRVDVRVETETRLGSCTGHDREWITLRAEANFCNEDTAGALTCTGRLPMSVIDWELRLDEEGYEVGRRRTAYYGLRADWRDGDLLLRRRTGRLGRGLRALLGRHSVAEVARIRREAPSRR